MARRGDICDGFNCTMFRHYRKKKYKTQKGFASRIGVGIALVCRWENGVTKPTYRNLIKIANILGIAPRLLIIPSKRHILDEWVYHLLDFLKSPPEGKRQVKVTRNGENGSETTIRTERELKLSTREAIEITERLGYFEKEYDDELEGGISEAEQQDTDLLEEGDVPEAYKATA